MAIRDFAHTHEGAGGDALAIPTVAAMIAVLFAGSTVLTPLYIVYKQQFGFSQITLTLIYAVYVVGNLAALLMFGGVSDVVGRRPASLAAMLVAIVSALVFLFAGNVASLDVARIRAGLASASARGPEPRGLPSFFPAPTSRAPV